jgi:predicted amidophosphoribosyltransferase
MTHPNREPVRPCCTGREDEPAVLASAPSDFDCPQCGLPTPTLNEGYCENCREDNQRRLDGHNAQTDWWQSLSPAERAAAIRRAE